MKLFSFKKKEPISKHIGCYKYDYDAINSVDDIKECMKTMWLYVHVRSDKGYNRVKGMIDRKILVKE